MLRFGFEPTIPAFERAKTVVASDSAATVIGSMFNTHYKLMTFYMHTLDLKYFAKQRVFEQCKDTLF
jgi:hypothetical protein